MIIIGKYRDIKDLLEKAVKAGYGHLAPAEAIRLYLKRPANPKTSKA